PVELLPVSPPTPPVVVEVLLAARGVHARRLEVTQRIGRDPDVDPGRRDGELADPFDDPRITDRLAALVYVGEPPAPTAPAQAGGGRMDPTDARGRYHGGCTTTRPGKDENMPPPGDSKRKTRATRCPICGRGELRDITFDGGTGEVEGTPTQLADSSEVDVYTCGHEVTGASLARADRSLHVERRASEDTAPAPEGPSGRGQNRRGRTAM